MSTILIHARAQLARYFDRFPDEIVALQALAMQLRDPAQDPFVRSNMTGHITVSTLVLDPERAKALFIHHKLFDRLLPPGGHIEPEDTIIVPSEQPTPPSDLLWRAAKRETAEETGLLQMLLHGWCRQAACPIDIDSHPIPANPAKGEGPHFHHDFMYLATADSTIELTPQLAEVKSAKWEDWALLYALENHRLLRIADKLVERQIIPRIDVAQHSSKPLVGW